MSNATRRPSRIILTGFSGTGKSSVAALVAERLGWRAVDTDDLIEETAGRAVADIFAREGEAAFRDLESEALREACAGNELVVSTGGGILQRPANRRVAASGGFVVCLEARPETVVQRLREAGADTSERPLLAGANPLARVRDLKSSRQALYALADFTVHTDGLTPEAVAADVVQAWRTRSEAALADPLRLEALGGGDGGFPGAACVVRASSGAYPVYVEWDALASLGRRLREIGLTGPAYVVSDETVLAEYGSRVEESLGEADIASAAYAFTPGEASKSLETAAAVYDWLVEHRAERGTAVVALGGGTVTDLAGYVAATYLRGLPLVHVPTSLLGMVDAAVGGKVAVNHPQAKNAIGAFYPPRFVLADPSTLGSLQPREVRSGWAEAIKHALILDADLLSVFESKAEAMLTLEPEATTEVIRRSVAIKAEVVSEDERETTGRRTLLNYGHTLGHAIEAVTGYERFRHGEADAIGMTAAAAISRRLGLLSAQEEARQRALLERFGLPTGADGLDREAVKAATALDKKVRGGAIRWVLLDRLGHAVLRDDVPPAAVDEALAEVLS